MRKIDWVSQPRLEPYIKQTGGDKRTAWELYEWNASMSAALTEVIHHAEILIRNAMVRELEMIHPLAFPWNQQNDTIATIAMRATNSKWKIAPTENDIISQLNLGFWTSLVASDDFQVKALWQDHLNNAFPHQPDRRKVGHALEDLRQLRNRCSHQDSLLHVDPAIEMKKIIRLAGWIDPDAADWISDLSKVDDVLLQRPAVANEQDTVIFASTRNRRALTEKNKASRYPLLDFYHQKNAIVIPDSIQVSRQVKYVGFYLPKDDPKQNPDPSRFVSQQPEAHIARIFPKILNVVVPNDWTREEVARLKGGTPEEKRVATIMNHALGVDYPADRGYAIYFLSEPNNPMNTLNLTREIPHDQTGRGSAFVKQTRYAHLDSIKAAHQTSDLLKEP